MAWRLLTREEYDRLSTGEFGLLFSSSLAVLEIAIIRFDPPKREYKRKRTETKSTEVIQEEIEENLSLESDENT